MTLNSYLKVLVVIQFIRFYSAQYQGTNYCVPNPCRTPSQCESLSNGFICHCVAGTRGKYCEKLMKPGEDICGSSPCWNGGTCLSNRTNWLCVCPQGKSGLDCRNYLDQQDYIVKIYSKGWYITKLTLYFRQLSTGAQLSKRTGSIILGQEQTFTIPFDADLNSVWFIAHALAGPNIFTLQLVRLQEQRRLCFHVWGAVFSPVWSFMTCW